MYQMFVYAKRYDAGKIFLLCSPTAKENFFSAADGFNVTIFPVDLFDIDTAVDKLCGRVLLISRAG